MSTSGVSEAGQSPASIWEDFVEIFFAPREVFARRSDGRFVIALIVVTLVIALLFYASQGPLGTALEAEFMRGMEEARASGQQLNAEQMEAARNMAGTFGVVGVLLAIPVGIFLTALVMWLIGKLFESAATFGLAMVVATYSQFPKVLQTAAGLLQGLLFDPQTLQEISLGPARFADVANTSQLALALLARLDLFIIWCTILIAIGLQVLGRMPRGRAYFVAVLVWLCGALPVIAGAVAR